MRRPRVRLTVGETMLSVAIIAAFLGAEFAIQRRIARLDRERQRHEKACELIERRSPSELAAKYG